MKRSAIDWEDPHIFPADGPPGKSASILSYVSEGPFTRLTEIREYRAKQVLGRWYPPAPLYFTPKKAVSQTSSTFSAPISPNPPNSSPEAETAQEIKVEIRGRSLKERRRALAAARFRIARERVEAAAAAPIPLPPPPPPAVIHDYKGWYHLLGVRPDTDYLRPNCAGVVSQQLKEKRLFLALRYHRDQGGSDKKMTQLNVAWDQLKGLEGRIRYHEKRL